MKTLYIALTALLLASTQAHAEIMQGDGIQLRSNPFSPFTKEKIELKNPDKITPTQEPSKQESSTQSQQNSSPSKINSQTTQPSINSIKISPSSVDFGSAVPGEPVIRSIGIEIKSGKGQQLMIRQDQKISSSDGTIQDTTCDTGICTHTVADIWSNPLTYGFGYTCKGSACLQDFKQNYFKQLPTRSENEPYVSFLISNEITTEAELQLKINLPPTSQLQSYNNNISLISVPKY